MASGLNASVLLSRRLLIAVALLAIATAAILLIRPPGVSPGAKLTFGVEVEISHLDPTAAHQPFVERVIGQVVDGLVGLNSKNEIEPVLAERWEHSDDFKTWTFRLRPNVYYHASLGGGAGKAKLVTAHDVAIVYSRTLRPDSFPSFILAGVIKGSNEFQKGLAAEVSGIRVVDDRTISFELDRPHPLFPYLITAPYFGIYDPSAIEESTGQLGKSVISGTGPFQLVSRSDDKVILKRSRNYWRKTTGNIETLEFVVIKNDKLRLDALRGGQIDAMLAPLSVLPSVVSIVEGQSSLNSEWKSRGVQLTEFQTFNSYILGFNVDLLSAPLRKAIAGALDRNELIRLVANGAAKPQVGIVPGSIYKFQSKLTDSKPIAADTNPSIVGAIPTQASSVSILVHDRDASETAGILIQAQLKKAGIESNVIRTDYEAAIQRMVQGNFQMVVMPFSFVFGTPAPILNSLFHSSKIPAPNFWRFKSAKVDGMLDELQRATTIEAASNLAADVEVEINADPGAISLFRSDFLILHKSSVRGLAFNGHSTPMLFDTTVK